MTGKKQWYLVYYTYCLLHSKIKKSPDIYGKKGTLISTLSYLYVFIKIPSPRLTHLVSGMFTSLFCYTFMEGIERDGEYDLCNNDVCLASRRYVKVTVKTKYLPRNEGVILKHNLQIKKNSISIVR